jgi:hypothetical protein
MEWYKIITLLYGAPDFLLIAISLIPNIKVYLSNIGYYIQIGFTLLS